MKTKLTKERQNKIVEAIEGGNYKETAAQYAGIHKATLYDWIKRGEEDTEQGKKTIYSDFADAIKEADAKAETRCVQLIQTAGTETWQAAAWYLERKHWERWGRKDKQQVELTKKPLDLKELTDEELDQLQKDITAAETT